MNHETIKKYVALRREKLGLEAEIKALNGDISRLAKEILDAMLDEEIRNFKTDEGVSFYLASSTSVKPKGGDPEAVLAYLDEHDLSEFAARRFDAKKLGAWLKERDADASEGIPAGFFEMFERSDYTEIRARGIK